MCLCATRPLEMPEEAVATPAAKRCKAAKINSKGENAVCSDAEVGRVVSKMFVEEVVELDESRSDLRFGLEIEGAAPFLEPPAAANAPESGSDGAGASTEEQGREQGPGIQVACLREYHGESGLYCNVHYE